MSPNGDLDRTGAPERLYRVIAECLTRLESGENCSAQELAAQYPEYQAEVEQFLVDYRGLEDLVSPLRADAESTELDGSAELPDRLSDYALLGVIGRGGMAVVYQARHLSLDRVVALKMVELPTPSAARRFRLEAQLAATLDHPNIVPIYDVGECEGRPFYTMKLFEGGSLADSLARGSWRTVEGHRRAAELTATVARAVHHAHEQGIFHRDLKPANVLLDSDGSPHVADFGLARRAAEPGVTQSGAIVGTPAYMPPEQAMGRKSGFTAADVYALGAILYELLAGQPVHDAATPIETLLRVIECDPVRPRQLDHSIPRDLETICLKCLEREPEKRYQSAEALADDLTRWLAGEPIVARPVSAPERAIRWARRHPTAVWVAGAVVLVALAAVWVGTFILQRERATSAEVRVRAEADARARLEEQHYFRVITLAARERAAGNPRRAEQLLAECPPSLRGWEWHYLRRQPLGTPAPLRGSSHLFALAISADGRLLAAGGSDGSIEIWDLELGTSRRFNAHQGKQVRGLAISPNGSRLASAGWDGRVVLWNVATGERVRDWECKNAAGQALDAFSVAFSPDGRSLAASVESEIRRWDLATGVALPPLLGARDVVRRVVFAPDGHELAAVDDSGRMKVWDLKNARPRLDFQAHPHLTFDVAYSADGTRLVTAGGQFYMHGDAGEVKVWSTADGSLVHDFATNTGAFYAAAFTLDARRIVAGGEDGRVRVWDAATGEDALAERGHVEAIWGLVFTSDGRRMYTAGGDKLVRLWDATPVPDPANSAGRAPGMHESRVTAVAFDPRGDILVSAGMDGVTHIRNAANEGVVRSLPPLRGHIHALAFSPDGRQLATAVWRPYRGQKDDCGVVVRDAKTWKIISHPLLGTVGVLGVAYSADGTLLAAATDHGVTVLDTATWKVVWEERHNCLVTSVAFGRDEVAYGDANGVVAFRDSRTGAVRGEPIVAHAGRVVGLVYSTDRTRIATASIDGAVAVWDAPSRKQICAPRGHIGGAYSVAFLPGGDRIVSAGNDGVVRVWDARTGREVAKYEGHTDAVHAVAAHPKSSRFASGGRDGSVLLWSLGREDWPE